LTNSPTNSPTTPTNTLTGSRTIPTNTLTNTPTTSTNTPTGSLTTPTNTPTNTPTGSPTTPTNTLTGSPTIPTNTLTNTPTTSTNTPTNTPTNSLTTPINTLTTLTNTPTGSPTNTPTNSPTTPTNTPTGYRTIPTNTPTNSPTTPTNTPTNSPTIPTNTLTNSPTGSLTTVAEKHTSRVPKPKVELPKFSDEAFQELCKIHVDIPTIPVTVLEFPRKTYKKFHRGINKSESREDYGLSIVEALGQTVIDNLKMEYGNIGINYKDGKIALRVFKGLMPEQLRTHFYAIANYSQGNMASCSTRRVQTIHLGAKEYTPNLKQQSKFGSKRVWTQDGNVTKEHTVAMLPEILFANDILKQVSKECHASKMKVPSKFRMATTCWTRVAINSTNCRFHRDFCQGVDILIYAGKWVMGGYLIIPQLGIIIFIQPGDVVVLDSVLFHKVSDFEGTRFSAVFFTKTHNEYSNSGELVVPDNLKWISNEFFKERK